MGSDSLEVQNMIHACDKGHHHLSTSWTIYVVDPDTAHNPSSYGEALFPVEVFDTTEQVDNIYRLNSFAPPNGPPSWSMVVPGGAIAVFQGGKFGFPAVKPQWEDPAARNGGELRFICADGVDGLANVDRIFADLINWMTMRPHYAGASILGLFVKNVAIAGKKENGGGPKFAIQFRLWISEAAPEVALQVTQEIARGMAKVMGDAGARGAIVYRSLAELISRTLVDPGYKVPRYANLRVSVPMMVNNSEKPHSPYPNGNGYA